MAHWVDAGVACACGVQASHARASAEEAVLAAHVLHEQKQRPPLPPPPPPRAAGGSFLFCKFYNEQTVLVSSGTDWYYIGPSLDQCGLVFQTLAKEFSCAR